MSVPLDAQTAWRSSPKDAGKNQQRSPEHAGAPGRRSIVAGVPLSFRGTAASFGCPLDDPLEQPTINSEARNQRIAQA
jgi:hypothetical protein